MAIYCSQFARNKVNSIVYQRQIGQDQNGLNCIRIGYVELRLLLGYMYSAGIMLTCTGWYHVNMHWLDVLNMLVLCALLNVVLIQYNIIDMGVCIFLTGQRCF
jgi:hypothetical protein